MVAPTPVSTAIRAIAGICWILNGGVSHWHTTCNSDDPPQQDFPPDFSLDPSWPLSICTPRSTANLNRPSIGGCRRAVRCLVSE
ncbi:hypothetical protein RB2682 [Rhodopirellula baltica SH 1]|uniref:Uncharacterized protein n=1 Tax=Rhodopirellula baltica (strain DSM 10527 / NCIMB 13988 / SH1) TaxID=243090 RepID=Q7UVE8_RHOBA|nr:hypothetical protein RB2682 [Rhodopirellula baltica SH 1]